jgi:putative tryptophan/tyrosine transport system substrate-binding protein
MMAPGTPSDWASVAGPPRFSHASCCDLKRDDRNNSIIAIDDNHVVADHEVAVAAPLRMKLHEGRRDRNDAATELVGLKPDAILVSTALILAPLQQQTSTIPIVFTHITDPVSSGIVASLARPGGNITGFAPAEFSMYGKLLEALKDAAPNLTRVAVVMNPEQAPQAGMLRAIEAVAPALAMKTSSLSVRNSIERSFASFAQGQNGGLIVLPNPVADVNRELIVRMAARHHLPAIYAYRYYVTSGGLMSYGIDAADQFKKAASYVDRILRGAKPAELPVQQPTKFELVINLKTAKALGLEVPPTLLARADEVIE